MENNKDLNNLIKLSNEYLSYETDKVLTWCGGCGNYAIQNSLTRALVLENYKVKDFLLCFDIGCNGNGSDKINAYTLHGLHGRVIPIATGCAIANPKMKVIASAGDGATFSEGINHLVNAIRNDYPILFIHHNNENYGLTIGQASSLTKCKSRMNGTPGEVYLDPINSLDFVLSLKPSFVARTFSGEPNHLTKMIQLGLKHKGFAYLEVLQSCPTYNKATPDTWYQERVKDIEEKKDYDNTNILEARALVQDIEKEIWIGLLYQNKEKKNFFESYPFRKEVETTLVEEVKRVKISDLI